MLIACRIMYSGRKKEAEKNFDQVVELLEEIELIVAEIQTKMIDVIQLITQVSGITMQSCKRWLLSKNRLCNFNHRRLTH